MLRSVTTSNFDDWCADPRPLTFEEYMAERVTVIHGVECAVDRWGAGETAEELVPLSLVPGELLRLPPSMSFAPMPRPLGPLNPNRTIEC